ncbi:MAG TPA: O-antigen ligase family protein [Solirubrobacteraceae bacterium]|nr:O-antigen ligase family protein [Solirubrobacteraceae bacterium]
MSPGSPPPPTSSRAGARYETPLGRLAGRGLWWPTLLVGGLVCFIVFYAKGGLNLESMTHTEIALTLVSAAAAALAIGFAPSQTRLYGAWSLGLLLAFTFLTALSVVWSVQPDDSWHDAGRMLAYSGVFGAALMLVRLAPERWPSLLGGIALAAIVVCGYAVASKVFPGDLAPANAYARLEEPFGYWNALGLLAAMGAICCMWLGSRRAGHALLSALAYPAMGLLLLTLVLAYSRGALAAFLVGLVLWFCLVPLRLRGAAVLIVGAVGAGVVAVWDFSQHALSSENVPLAARTTAGHQLGALVIAMLVLLTLAGIAIGFATARRAPSLVSRRRAGAILLSLIVIAILAFAGALAHSHRGFTGSISHAFNALTNPNAKPPPNTPGRLTAVASVRARYWKEALQVFDAHPALGSGAEGYATAHLRYRHETLNVRHAHGYVVQTLADLGVVGLAVTLALLLAWMAATGRATHPLNRRWSSWREWTQLREGARPGWRRVGESDLALYTPERIGLLTMLCLVVVFGVHSLVDWTWYVPGDACVALICAGWLAGRGALAAVPGAETCVPDRKIDDLGTTEHAGRWERLGAGLDPVRAGTIAAVIVAALLAAWSQWQPQRSEDARQEALALLASNRTAAEAAANRAVSRDPLSAEALFTLADVQKEGRRHGVARATLQKAVRLQPSNPQTWLELARFDLASNPKAAVSEFQAAIYLNPELISTEAISPPNAQPESVEVYNDYIQALRASATARSASESRARAGRAALRGSRRGRGSGLLGSQTPRSAG